MMSLLEQGGGRCPQRSMEATSKVKQSDGVIPMAGPCAIMMFSAGQRDRIPRKQRDVLSRARRRSLCTIMVSSMGERRWEMALAVSETLSPPNPSPKKFPEGTPGIKPFLGGSDPTFLSHQAVLLQQSFLYAKKICTHAAI